MDILYSYETSYKGDMMFAVIFTTVILLVLTTLLIAFYSDSSTRKALIFSVVFFFIATIVSIFAYKSEPFKTCHHEVLLKGSPPSGYSIEDSRGYITTIEQDMSESEYKALGCTVESSK